MLKSLALAAGLTVAAAASANAAFTVSVTPSTDLSLLSVGDVFTLTLALDDAPVLTGGTLAMNYDADVLAYQGGVFDAIWFIANDQAAQGVGASGPTTINGIAFSQLFGTVGPGVVPVGEFQFEAIAAGNSDVTFGDAFGGFVNGLTTGIPVDTYESASTSVSPSTATAPVPLALLAAGALAVGWRMRRG